MFDPQEPKKLERVDREPLGKLTLALAEDVFRLNNPRLSMLMRELMLEVGRVIARNLDGPDVKR